MLIPWYLYSQRSGHCDAELLQYSITATSICGLVSDSSNSPKPAENQISQYASPRVLATGILVSSL